jgi:hypothetical protein
MKWGAIQQPELVKKILKPWKSQLILTFDWMKIRDYITAWDLGILNDKEKRSF